MRALAAGAVGLTLVSGAGCGSAGGAGGADRSTNGDPGTTAPGTAAPGAATFGEVETAFTGSGPRVVVLGDSIMVATRTKLRAALDGYSLKVAAVSGEGLSGGPISVVVGGGGMTDVADTYGQDRPDVVVIELGTNDAWLEELGLDAALRALDQIVDAFPDSCLVTVTVTESASAEGYDPDEARQINGALTAVADQVVDWRTLSTEGAGLVKPDGIHPTSAGTEALSAAIDATVRECTG